MIASALLGVIMALRSMRDPTARHEPAYSRFRSVPRVRVKKPISACGLGKFVWALAVCLVREKPHLGLMGPPIADCAQNLSKRLPRQGHTAIFRSSYALARRLLGLLYRRIRERSRASRNRYV
jgi:hypothetical protein